MSSVIGLFCHAPTGWEGSHDRANHFPVSSGQWGSSGANENDKKIQLLVKTAICVYNAFLFHAPGQKANLTWDLETNNAWTLQTLIRTDIGLQTSLVSLPSSHINGSVSPRRGGDWMYRAAAEGKYRGCVVCAFMLNTPNCRYQSLLLWLLRDASGSQSCLCIRRSVFFLAHHRDVCAVRCALLSSGVENFFLCGIAEYRACFLVMHPFKKLSLC